MNKIVKEKWIASLKENFKTPDYLRLLFPLRISSAKGEMFSAFGLLCELHSKETGKAWSTKTIKYSDITDEEDIDEDAEFDEDGNIKPKKKSTKKKKSKPKPLRDKMLIDYDGYLGSTLVPPNEVLEWAGLSAGHCANITAKMEEGSYEKVVEYLEGL